MTEAQWMACVDARKKVEWLRGRATDRKLRLFACAYWRWHTEADGDPEMPRVLAHAEHGAEHGFPPSHPSEPPLPIWAKWHPLFARKATDAANWTIRKTAGHKTASGKRADEQHLLLLADIFGPLPSRTMPSLPPSAFTWNDGCVVKLAADIYGRRKFTRERMGVLADALEKAGCSDPVLLPHLRGPGPHVRGCFAVDALLGKS